MSKSAHHQNQIAIQFSSRMSNIPTDKFSDLTQLETLLVGALITIIAYSVVILFWKRIVRYAERSDNLNDKEAVAFLKPFVHGTTILTGLYLTVKYSFPDNPTYLQNTSKFIFITTILITALTLSRSLDRNLPKIFATLDERKEIGLSRSTNLISSVSKLIIWLTSFLLLLTLFDIEITAAVASLTVFSLVIGMALQESASNMIISGQLMLDSPYDIGDKIEVNGRIGVVTDIGVLSTKVTTPGEQLMVIPNKIMASSTITNFARGGPKEHPERVNLRIDIGVGYGESPEHVKNVIRDILQKNDAVVNEPKPLILLTDLLDSSLSFRVNTHVNNYQNEWIVRDQILSEMIRRFRDEGIEIPFPHLQVIRETDDANEDKKKLARVKKAEKEEAKISEDLIMERNANLEEIEITRERLSEDDIEPEKATELQERLIELESELFIGED